MHQIKVLHFCVVLVRAMAMCATVKSALLKFLNSTSIFYTYSTSWLTHKFHAQRHIWISWQLAIYHHEQTYLISLYEEREREMIYINETCHFFNISVNGALQSFALALYKEVTIQESQDF